MEIKKEGDKKNNEKVGQEQFHYFVFDDKVSWQEIIYDLINTEQLDPWDINLAILSEKYLERVRALEEANFMLSSKVLLICSLMLRIKSELLLNRYIKDIDETLMGKKEDKQETLNFEYGEDYDDLPLLMPRTPLPRYKKVSLQELISALSKAIQTDDRRTERKKTEREIYERTKTFIPKQKINIQERIKEVHAKITGIFQKQDKVKFSEFSGPKKQDKIDHFIPLLHLDNHNHLYLHQKQHLEEIWIHKDGKEFIDKNDIITDSISREFEESIEKEELEKSEKLFDPEAKAE